MVFSCQLTHLGKEGAAYCDYLPFGLDYCTAGLALLVKLFAIKMKTERSSQAG